MAVQQSETTEKELRPVHAGARMRIYSFLQLCCNRQFSFIVQIRLSGFNLTHCLHMMCVLHLINHDNMHYDAVNP